MSLATEKQRKLRRLLTEEDLSFVVVTNLTERIKGITKKKKKKHIEQTTKKLRFEA